MQSVFSNVPVHTEAKLVLTEEANVLAEPLAEIRGNDVDHEFGVNELTTLNNKAHIKYIDWLE